MSVLSEYISNVTVVYLVRLSHSIWMFLQRDVYALSFILINPVNFGRLFVVP